MFPLFLITNVQGVTDVLCEACDQLGWKVPTKIQIEAIPVALQGEHCTSLILNWGLLQKLYVNEFSRVRWIRDECVPTSSLLIISV